MKIGVDALFLIPGEVGGSETWFRKTMMRLPEIMEGDEFAVYASEECFSALAADLSAYDNVTMVRTHVSARSRIRRYMFEQFELPDAVRAKGADVLFCPGNVCPVLRRCRCPVVSLVYDMQYARHPEDFSAAGLAAMRFFTPRTARRSARVVTISEFSRREIAECTGTPFDRIDVVRGGADDIFSKKPDPEYAAERRMVLLHTDAPYILTVANSYPHKRLETAVEAFGSACRGTDMRYVLVGKARRGERALAEAVEKLPDKSRFIRLSHVTESDLAVLYQGASVFLFPSVYEGFGLPVLEAMCAGAPVAAVRAGSVPEVGGLAAAYAEPDAAGGLCEALGRVLALTPDAREAMISQGRSRMRMFSWDETARALAGSIRAAAEGCVV